jgi:hypothetical protein
MTDDDTPWEPPVAGTETEQLLGALERLRMTFRWKTDGLDAAGLQTVYTNSRYCCFAFDSGNSAQHNDWANSVGQKTVALSAKSLHPRSLSRLEFRFHGGIITALEE